LPAAHTEASGIIMGNLTSSERQIAIASGLVVILSLYALFAQWGGFMFVTLLAGLAALVILYLPQIAPNMKAPGSKGSLLMVSGLLAALFWLLAVLYWLNYIFNNIVSFDVLLFVIGFVASLWLGWLAWSAFQAEGGKFQFGNTDMGTGGTATAAAPPAETTASPPAETAAAAPPPAAAPPAEPPPATPAPSQQGAPAPAAPAADPGMSTPSSDSGMGSPPSGGMGSDEENRA
jgi:hypothetical protein